MGDQILFKMNYDKINRKLLEDLRDYIKRKTGKLYFKDIRPRG